jgi:hypothetical protein
MFDADFDESVVGFFQHSLGVQSYMAFIKFVEFAPVHDVFPSWKILYARPDQCALPRVAPTIKSNRCSCSLRQAQKITGLQAR